MQKLIKKIDLNKLHLTPAEINKNFEIKFVDKESLYNMLSIDHSNVCQNGKFFDEENNIVMNKILKLKK